MSGIVWPWPAPFDPLNSTDEARAVFGLPSRPDGAAAPKLLAAWTTLMSSPLSCSPVAFAEGCPFTVSEGDPSKMAISHTASSVRPTETSRNWSGAYIRPVTAANFTHVAATWVVPNVQPTPPPTPNAPFPDGDYACSVWVGLDGHDPGSLSMPQIGIHHQVICRNNILTRKLFGWVQWWDKLRKTRYSKFNGFNVATGETIMAYLTLGPGGNSAKLIIKNLTTGYMAIPVDMAAPAGAPAVGATAEWVVERPNIQGSDKVWTFPNYGTVVMNQCVAGFGANPAAGLLGEQTLEYARTINLVTWDDPLHLGETVSSAEVLNDQSILASYVPR